MRISALSWISRCVGLGGVASYWNSSVVSSGISLFLMLGSTFTISSKTCWTFLPNLVREGVLVGEIVVRRLWSPSWNPRLSVALPLSHLTFMKAWLPQAQTFTNSLRDERRKCSSVFLYCGMFLTILVFD